jgi:uncharacterized membrane protein
MESIPGLSLQSRAPTRSQPLQGFLDGLDRRSPVLLAAAVLAYIVAFTLLSGLKLALFRQGFDMAGNEQTLWNTLHGRFFRISAFANMDYDFDDGPVLLQLPLALLYGLRPSPYTLLALQSIALGLAALPLYLLGRSILPRPWHALALALVYLLHPWTQHTNMYEFQLRSFMVPFALAALLFLWQQRLWPLYLCLVLMMATKTEGTLVVASFGLYALSLRRPWPFVVPPILLGAAWFVLALFVVVPAFSKGEFIGKIYSYGVLGESLGDVILSLFTRPLLVLDVIFEPAKLRFLLRLFGLLLFLPLLGPVSVLGAPILFMNIISPNAVQYSLNYQYQALTIPFLIVGAAQGLLLLQRRAPEFVRERLVGLGMLALLLVMLAANLLLNNVVLGLARNHEPPARVAQARALIAQVPEQAALAASSFLAPHLAQRQQLYFFPGNKSYPPDYIERAEFIAADLAAPRASEVALLRDYMARPDWRLVAREGDFVLLRKRP